MSLSHEINETVTVSVGVLGRVETALGTATIHQVVEADDGYELSRKIGDLIGAAYRDAYVEALTSFQPDLRKHWVDQGVRDRDTDEGTTRM